MEIKEFTVRDRLPRPITFRGLLLADCRYGSEVKLRWTDMALYRVIGRRSDFRYALEITARSVVYHKADGPCARPERHRISTISEVRSSPERWGILIPCNRTNCAPEDLEKMDDADLIAEEVEEPHTYLCTYATDIIDRLYHHSGEISELAADMLRKAAQNDSYIKRALEMRWRI